MKIRGPLGRAEDRALPPAHLGEDANLVVARVVAERDRHLAAMP